jgi:hypothetical protein
MRNIIHKKNIKYCKTLRGKNVKRGRSRETEIWNVRKRSSEEERNKNQLKKNNRKE